MNFSPTSWDFFRPLPPLLRLNFPMALAVDIPKTCERTAAIDAVENIIQAYQVHLAGVRGEDSRSVQRITDCRRALQEINNGDALHMAQIGIAVAADDLETLKERVQAIIHETKAWFSLRQEVNEDVDDPTPEGLYPADPDILRDITDDETRELPAVSMTEPGSWDELVALNQAKLEEPLTVPDPVAWRLETEPLTTPEGDTMGYALYCTRFPDSADPVPDFDTPQRAERLEMAHFSSEEQSKRFEIEFRSYLVPGLIDGPELAEEVAKLEGMPHHWQEVREHSITELDQSEDAPNIAAVSLDW